MIQLIANKLNETMGDDAAVELIEQGVVKVTYLASGLAVVGGLTINEWCAIAGGVAAIATAVFNMWFKWKYLKPRREKRNATK